MKSRLAIILTAVLSTGLISAQQTPTDKPAPQPKRVDPSVIPIEDVAGLPRVLLIGDSISMGYTLPVRKLLEGKANVHRIPTNGGPTKKGVTDIEKWLGNGNWDIIHFNFGLHDLRHMDDGNRQVDVEAYEKNLRALVARMKQTNATLIWATTTPVPEGKLNPQRTFGDVKIYNDIAAKVMQENGIRTNDLNAAVTPELATLQKPRDVHFNPSGSEFLGVKTAAAIQTALDERKK